MLTENALKTLYSMFEMVDPEVIHMILIEECDGNMEHAVQALSIVTGGTSHSDIDEKQLEASDTSRHKGSGNPDIGCAALVIDELLNCKECEREKSIKLLSKIYQNIKLHPNEAKYRRLNVSKISSKKGVLPEVMTLLFYSGFNAHSDGVHFHLSDISLNLCLAVGQLFEARKSKIDDYVQRICETFERYKLESDNEALNDFVYEQYGGKISNFLNDCHRFIANMDSNRKYLVCSRKDCVFLERRHRYKRNENGNKQSMIRERLQQIHILCHQYDEEQKMKNDKNYKRQMIEQKNAESEDVDEKEEPQSNKFVTDIGAPSASLMDGKYLKYSEGFRFYYHSFYKDKEIHILGKEYNLEVIPNYRHSSATKHQTFKDWYVSPKYKNLKEEIVNGGHLTWDQFKNEINKAEQNICTAEAKTLRATDEFEERYNVQTGSAITINHMLCIMLYTNHYELQHKLSKTFRKLTEIESDEQLKERHTAFVNISRLMTETIWCFGNNESEVNVYHGVNASTLFKHFIVKFSGPTSTTTSENIAINFATNGGTVITIQGANGCYVSNHFDCELWSDYPWEKEKLFIGMDSNMLIVNVHDIRNDIEYEEWIDVIRAFNLILVLGTMSTSPISHFVEKNVHLLIDSVQNNSVKPYIPEYIVDTFNHIRMNVKFLVIDLNLLSKGIDWKDKHSDIVFYGGKKFENIYFDQNRSVKWTLINLLFPNLRKVQFAAYIAHEEDLSMYSWSNSILLTDDVLNDIFVFLKVSNIEWIHICSPQNNEYSLIQQIAKFSAKYKEIGYNFDVFQSEKSHRYLNQCTVFGIESITGK